MTTKHVVTHQYRETCGTWSNPGPRSRAEFPAREGAEAHIDALIAMKRERGICRIRHTIFDRYGIGHAQSVPFGA